MEARLMKGHKTARVVLIAGLVAAIGAGCSSSAKSSSPTTTTLPVETKGFQVETPGGQVSLSLDGLLPPNWPANFPVAPNASPAGSGSRGDTAQTSLVGVYSSTDAPDETYRFYASTSAYHVDSKSSIGAGSVFVGKVSFSGAFTGNATVVSRNGTTYVVVMLQTPGASTTVAT
jgi:hypothetical protein